MAKLEAKKQRPFISRVMSISSFDGAVAFRARAKEQGGSFLRWSWMKLVSAPVMPKAYPLTVVPCSSWKRYKFRLPDHRGEKKSSAPWKSVRVNKP